MNDRCVAIDTEFDNRKVPFIATTCDWQLKTDLVNCHSKKELERLRDIAEDRSITKVMFPVTVDWHVLKNVGIRCRGEFEDVLAAGVLLNENWSNRHGLKAMAERYLGADIQEKKALAPYIRKYKKKAKEQNIEFDWAMLPKFVLKPYAIQDAVFTQKLWFLFRTPLQRFIEIYNLEKRVTRVALKMQEHGMMVDRPFVKKISKQYTQELIDSMQRMKALMKQHHIRMKDFKPNSPQQVAYVLDKMGVKLPKNENGNPITDAPTLQKFDDHKMVNEILLFKFIKKQKTAFIDPLWQRHSTDDDPYARFLIFLSGTKTGRQSAELIQTMPRPEESRTAHAPKLARQSFIPRPGYRLLAIDYKALQMRLFYHYAKAKMLIEKVKQGWDPHDATTQLLFGELTKDLRKDAKNIGFGIVFGMGTNKLIAQLQKSKARKSTSRVQAHEILNTYYKLVPVREFTHECISKLYRTGVLELRFDSPLMSGYREYNVPQEFAYKGPNVLIQGTEAYVVKSAMLRCAKTIREKGCDVSMLIAIHDELLFEVSQKEPLHHIVKILSREMEDHITFDVPLEVDAKVSDLNWGAVQEWSKVKDQYPKKKVFNV